MKIGILGGSFNPPHLGHQLICMQAKQEADLDEIWLMPVNKHPFDKSLAPAEHRLAMLKYLGNDYIKISKYELERDEKNYTIDTLGGLMIEYPTHKFYWIIGSDQLEKFQKYKNWRELITKYNLIIFPREIILPEIETKVKEAFLLKSIPDNILVLNSGDLIMSNISSHLIRERIKNNDPITYLTPERVERYIIENNLYK